MKGHHLAYMICMFTLGIVMFFVMGLYLSMGFAASASEIEAPATVGNEFVEDEQSEADASPPMSSYIDDEIVEDEQSELEDLIKQETLVSPVEVTPFASGVLVGELADLLQNNIIENDGYTEESWQRYEDATAAGWDVIANFMILTDDEVRAVIDELNASIVGLEYPEDNKPSIPNLDGLSDIMPDIIIAIGFVSGLLVVLAFSGGARNGI